jgi:hypothetical protein
MFKRLLHKLGLGHPGSSPQLDETSNIVEEIDLTDVDDPELRSAFESIARLQASGLDGAIVTIHSVTAHTSFHEATPHPGQKLIVVDVTFKDHKTGFGLAGILLIDGEKQAAESYGGDPYKVYLEEDGSLMKDQSGNHLVGPMDWNNEKPIRVFLVYSAPKAVTKVGLTYWDKIIVDRPYVVKDAG